MTSFRLQQPFWTLISDMAYGHLKYDDQPPKKHSGALKSIGSMAHFNFMSLIRLSPQSSKTASQHMQQKNY